MSRRTDSSRHGVLQAARHRHGEGLDAERRPGLDEHVSRTSTGDQVQNRDRTLIDHRFPLDDELDEAIHENRPVAKLVGTGGATARTRSSATSSATGSSSRSTRRSRTTARTRAIGAYEIYANPQALGRLIGSRRTMLWLAVGGVFLALWAALALLVRGASRTLSRQNEKLRARTRGSSSRTGCSRRARSTRSRASTRRSTRRIRTPPGHSQRVQRIAVALGEELGLERERLDVAPLRRPLPRHRQDRRPRRDPHEAGPADGAEFEIVKRHPEDGARIVGRLHRLHAAVPAILHHHERWDGNGYPHGLRGDEIPLEAAIVGLADAVDAMTTDRPYSAPGRSTTRPTRSCATAARSSRRRSSTPSSRSWSGCPSCSGPTRWPTSSFSPEAIGSADGRPDRARGLPPRGHARALPRRPGAVQEAFDRRGRARSRGPDLDADAGLRLRARPDRPPLGGPRRRARASTPSC